MEEFVSDLLLIPPKQINDFTKEEVLLIVTLILNDECSLDTTFYINLLKVNFPNGNASDLIFNPDALGYDIDVDFSAEEIADMIFNSKIEKPADN